METTTIRVRTKDRNKFKKLCEKIGRSQTEQFHQWVASIPDGSNPDNPEYHDLPIDVDKNATVVMPAGKIGIYSEKSINHEVGNE